MHRVSFYLYKVTILPSIGIFSKIFKHPMLVGLTRSRDNKMDIV